ncbi:NAD(P)-binding protein [Aspergillus indologenus CBS 114.80]|uniref:NAD(P)-binding protein n=1 Tax=Aspergillus indologenus CBS 114.80 TaxID=1450541 RepID=A0A2V5HRK3_9EURO|nr:NAD(P)-binding protein [Aspergillus indologenus CBS 114.80]
MTRTTNPLKIAVVGLGRMGKRHVHTLLYRVPHAQVVGVCSSDASEVKWARNNQEYSGFGITVYDNYDQMLNHPAAIAKDLHVLCEKPLSTDLAEAQSVVDAARAKPSLKVMAGFSRRFDASYRDAAAKIYDQGAIGTPFLVRSNTCDLRDETGFFVRYAARNGGIFVDCAIHDIDLSLWFLGNPTPKACWAAGTLQHHPELRALSDVDNAVGVVEFWGGKIAYFYCSRTQAHGHDVCTEITGTEGKLMVNVVPRQNNVVLADRLGLRHEVQPEYWERFEHAFALEANEFIAAVREDREVPLPLEAGMKVTQIGQALQHALLSGEVVRFDESGTRLN